jgi:hypothetical protein
MNIKQEFDTITDLVKHILEHYPETRNSDNKLFIRCAQYKGAKTLSDLENIKLNLISCYKARQLVQNKLGLFKPNEEVQEVRKYRAGEIKKYMIS